MFSCDLQVDLSQAVVGEGAVNIADSDSAEIPIVAVRRSTCQPSAAIGYACMQKVDSATGYTMHWSRPDDNTVVFAIEARGEGWLALGFPVTPGSMTGAKAVQGSPSQGTRTILMTDMFPSSFQDVDIVGVDANDLAYEVNNGVQLLKFSRSIGDGFSIGGPIAMIGAHHDFMQDWDVYHGPTARWSFEVRIFLQSCSAGLSYACHVH